MTPRRSPRSGSATAPPLGGCAARAESEWPTLPLLITVKKLQQPSSPRHRPSLRRVLARSGVLEPCQPQRLLFLQRPTTRPHPSQLSRKRLRSGPQVQVARRTFEGRVRNNIVIPCLQSFKTSIRARLHCHCLRSLGLSSRCAPARAPPCGEPSEPRRPSQQRVPPPAPRRRGPRWRLAPQGVRRRLTPALDPQAQDPKAYHRAHGRWSGRGAGRLAAAPRRRRRRRTRRRTRRRQSRRRTCGKTRREQQHRRPSPPWLRATRTGLSSDVGRGESVASHLHRHRRPRRHRCSSGK